MSAPDPRDRQIAELTARVDALQKPAAAPPRKAVGCLGMALRVGLVLFLLGLAMSIAGPYVFGLRGGARTASAELVPLDPHCDGAWADRIVEKARRVGALRGVEGDVGDRVAVMNPLAWNLMTLGGQKLLGLAIACQGVERPVGSVTFRYDREGKDLMRLSDSELFELAMARFPGVPAAPAPSGLRGVAWGGPPPRGVMRFPGSDYVWVDAKKPPPAFLGVSPSDEDYTFEHGRLDSGDVYFKGEAVYEALKAALAKAYGPPSDVNGDVATWAWPAAKVKVQLIRHADQDSTIVHFLHD